MKLSERLVEAKRELEAMSAAYTEARKHLKSPEYVADQVKVLGRLRSILGGALSPRPAEFTLGQAREALRPIEEPEEAVRAYESKRELVRSLQARLASEGEAGGADSLAET